MKRPTDKRIYMNKYGQIFLGGGEEDEKDRFAGGDYRFSIRPIYAYLGVAVVVISFVASIFGL
jgi:hypothetical protein